MKDAIRSTAKALGPAGVLAVLWLVAPALLGFVLVANLSAASNWLETLGPAAPYVFALIFAVTSGLGILPTYAQAVVAGWVFEAPLEFLQHSAALSAAQSLGGPSHDLYPLTV